MDKTTYHVSGVNIPFKAECPPDEGDIAVCQHIVDELHYLIDQFQNQVAKWGERYSCKAHLKTEVEHIEIL